MRLLLIALLICSYFNSFGQLITNDFDEGTGANSYSVLSNNNWTDGASFNIQPNAGTELFATANGNAAITFYSLGITKDLGGVIEDHPYRVSFYIATYNDGSLPLVGVNYADFIYLYIGRPNGTMVWDTVPTPTVYGQWVKWSGIYTPDATEIGQSFQFHCFFNLEGYHSVAFDGAMAVNSPTTDTKDSSPIETERQLVRIVDMLGRDTEPIPNTPLLYQYSDGSVEKIIRYAF